MRVPLWERTSCARVFQHLRLRQNGVTLASDTFAGKIVAVPQPGTWAMLILGFGVIGGAMRRRGGPVSAHGLK